MFKDYRTNDELLLIVGENRSGYPASEVLKAENELRKRTSSEYEQFKKKIKRAGIITAFIGGLILPLSVAILVMFIPAWKDFSDNASSDPFIFRYFHFIFLAINLFQLALTIALLIGGIALYQYRDWGRKIIKGVLIAVMGYGFIFSIAWIVLALAMPKQHSLHPIKIVLLGSGWSIFLLYLLWLPLRYFSSSRVRQECH